MSAYENIDIKVLYQLYMAIQNKYKEARVVGSARDMDFHIPDPSTVTISSDELDTILLRGPKALSDYINSMVLSYTDDNVEPCELTRSNSQYGYNLEKLEDFREYVIKFLHDDTIYKLRDENFQLYQTVMFIKIMNDGDIRDLCYQMYTMIASGEIKGAIASILIVNKKDLRGFDDTEYEHILKILLSSGKRAKLSNFISRDISHPKNADKVDLYKGLRNLLTKTISIIEDKYMWESATASMGRTGQMTGDIKESVAKDIFTKVIGAINEHLPDRHKIALVSGIHIIGSSNRFGIYYDNEGTYKCSDMKKELDICIMWLDNNTKIIRLLSVYEVKSSFELIFDDIRKYDTAIAFLMDNYTTFNNRINGYSIESSFMDLFTNNYYMIISDHDKAPTMYTFKNYTMSEVFRRYVDEGLLKAYAEGLKPGEKPNTAIIDSIRDKFSEFMGDLFLENSKENIMVEDRLESVILFRLKRDILDTLS